MKRHIGDGLGHRAARIESIPHQRRLSRAVGRRQAAAAPVLVYGAALHQCNGAAALRIRALEQRERNRLAAAVAVS